MSFQRHEHEIVLGRQCGWGPASPNAQKGWSFDNPTSRSFNGWKIRRKAFIYAIQNGLVALTRDRDDFDDLHNVVLAAGGTHPGIFTIRFERDSSKNMKPKHIAAAIAKVEKAGIPLANQLSVLNHWR